MAFEVNRQKNVRFKDEGITITDNTLEINTVGAGVTSTAIGNNVTETISGGASGTIVNEEVPTPAVDGSTTVFSLANTPSAGTLKVYLGGARQQSGGGDYTLSGSTITFNVAPPSGSILFADYNY